MKEERYIHEVKIISGSNNQAYKLLPQVLMVVFLILAAIPDMMGQQAPRRPPIFGIAKMTYWVSDFQLAQDYYGKYLDFDEAFRYSSPFGEVISFKIM